MNRFVAWSLASLDSQGYCLTEEEKRRLTVPLKFSSGLCAVLGAAFVIAGWVPGLLAVAAIAVAGAVLPRHPFDYLYRYLLNPVLGTGLAPRNTPQRRFACAGGAAMLGGSAWLFTGGYDAAAFALGGAFVAVAVVVTATNWCLPSFIYNNVLVRAGFPAAGPDVAPPEA